MSVWVRLALAVALLFGAAAVHAGDELYYVMEGDRVVFTNAPARGGARPVPGMESTAGPIRKGLAPTIYDPFIERVARENGLSPALLKAVAQVESGFDPHAVSPKGAQGIMQLMPATARQYGVKDSFDPLESLSAGARHLRVLLDEFDSDETLALAAYNAGSGAVRRHGGVPAYPETQAYVRKVQERLGRNPTTGSSPADSREIRLSRRADGTLELAN